MKRLPQCGNLTKKRKTFLFGFITLFLVITSEVIFLQFNAVPAAVNVSLEAQNVKETCAYLGNPHAVYFCYGKVMGAFVQKHSLSEGVRVFALLQKIDRRVEFCHGIAHDMVDAQIRKDPGRWLDVFKEIDVSWCQDGFFHGVIEGYGRYSKIFHIDEYSIPVICAQIDQITHVTQHPLFEIRNCPHEFGHVLLVQERGDVKRAIAICQRLADAMREDCGVGVFMENDTRNNLSFHGVKEKIPWNEKTAREEEKLCNAFPFPQSRPCWREISYIYLSLAHNDYKTLYKYCLHAPISRLQAVCYREAAVLLGTWMYSGSVSSKNFSQLCDPFLGNSTFIDCVHDFNMVLMRTPQYINQYLPFCQGMKQQEKNTCLKDLAYTMQLYLKKATIVNTCQQGRVKEFCRQYLN